MQHKILFVDDSALILKTIQLAFAKEQFNVLIAESGEDGLKLVEQHRPSVIVSDLRMPGMNGLEFLDKAREIDDSWIGMIFSAYLDIDCVMQAVGDEAVWRFIAKPWGDNREMVYAVQNAVQMYEARAAKQRAEEKLARSERLAALGRLATGVAHQFNNINVCVVGYAEMARRKDYLPLDVQECLENISRSARRATGVINELLYFGNQSSAGFSSCRLSDVALDAVSTHRKEMEEDGVALEYRLGDTPEIDMDALLIRQVLNNLLTNAWHATLGQEVRKVALKTGQHDGRVFARVRDNGSGIRQEDQTKIFDLFFSTKGERAVADSPQAALRGVGLGLSVCHTIAENHGGEITVETEPGEGSTFTLWLPLHGSA